MTERTLANQITTPLCAQPWQVRSCTDCARNRANRPEGTWSPVPDVAPVTRNGACTYWLGLPVRHPA